MQWLIVAILVVTCAVVAIRWVVTYARRAVGVDDTESAGGGCSGCGSKGCGKQANGPNLVTLQPRVRR